MQRPLLLLALLLPSLACPADDDDTGGDTGSESGSATTTATTATTASTTDSTTASTSASTSATTASSTTDPSETTSDPAESSEGSTAPSDESGSGSEAPADESGSTGSTDLCAPEGSDDPCITCAKEMCCDAYAECYGDDDCVCAVDCILETFDYETCLGPKCNMPDPMPAQAIGMCYAMTCADACGF